MAWQAKKTFGGPRKNWHSLMMLNRVPEVELQHKLDGIMRFHAQHKRDRRIEEARMWDELYENNKILKTSIAKLPRQEVVRSMILIEKDPGEDDPEPFSEYYRKFVVFKAKQMAQLFGKKAPRKPRYSELYDRQSAPERNNKTSIHTLFSKYHQEQETDQKTLNALNGDLTERETKLAHFPFEADKPTADFTAQKLIPSSQTNVSMIEGEETKESKRSLLTEPAFRLPPIADRFKTKKDRKIKQGIEAGEDGIVSPDLETIPGSPNVINRKDSGSRSGPISRSNTEASE